MSEASNFHPAAARLVIDFLKATLPFSELDSESLERLATGCIVGFFPKRTLVLQQGVSDVQYLYLIHKGAVRIYGANAKGTVTLEDHRGEGAHIGALSLIRGTKAHLSAEAVEDTFCFLLHRNAFLELVKNNPVFAENYCSGLSQDLVCKAYSEVRCARMGVRNEDASYLFGARIQDVIARPPETVGADEPLYRAASRMAEQGIGSLLITDQAENIVGIVTDRDLRSKVVARRMDFELPVAEIMTSPVTTIQGGSTCFDAVLQMMDRRIHHLAVERDGRIVGVVTPHDLLVCQGSSPMALLKEVSAQRKIAGLYPLARKIPGVVRGLAESGAKAHHITRMISVINDHVLGGVLSLLTQEMGTPPVPFCWLAMGSDGRREQTFVTDQDNAILYRDPGDEWDNVKAAKLYFRQLGNEAVQHLLACGYPLCTSGIMASVSKWRKPYAVWAEYFDRWISTSQPEETLNATICFDFRASYGDFSLAYQLRAHESEQARRSNALLKCLALDCLGVQPPLSFFRNFVVEKDGEHENNLDLKRRGLMPIVDFARLVALRHGITERNTSTRLEILQQGGLVPAGLANDTIEAYEFLMHLRLVHQLKLIEAGQGPHSYVDPAGLSELERRILKEAFAVINRIQEYVARSMATI